MSIADDGGYIAKRMAQIARERAQGLGIAAPDEQPKYHTGGILKAPPELLGSIFFGPGNMFLYGEHGADQIKRLSLIMIEVGQRQIQTIRLEGFAEADERGLDVKASAPMLAAKRVKCIRDCVVTGMAFTGTVLVSDVKPGNIVTPGFISPESHCRRVDVFAEP